MAGIRPEEPPDIPAIAGVLRSAFAGEVEVQLVKAIRASAGFIPGLSLVAVENGQVVGHVLLSRVEIRSASSGIPALALAPVAVLPAHRGQGIGSRLVEEGLRRSGELGHAIVIVVGEPGFSARFGFTPAGERGLTAPFPVPGEAFMVLGLRAGALAGISGLVSYPPAFLAGIPE